MKVDRRCKIAGKSQVNLKKYQRKFLNKRFRKRQKLLEKIHYD